MEPTPIIAALFDFDGVIMDTETQYTLFWDKQGARYLGIDSYGRSIKGQTLTQIYAKDFAQLPDAQQAISRDLQLFEANMAYEYIPGVQPFLTELRNHGVRLAVVTSSDDAKMQNVYRAHPEFATQFDHILTAACFTRSKPAPDCFLLGMSVTNASPTYSFVFEDSFHGLQAGMDSGATVIGLATTNSREAISSKAHHVIDDFRNMSYEKLLTLRVEQ